MTGLMTQTGGTCMDSSEKTQAEMEREWNRLSKRSNDLLEDIYTLEIRIKYRDSLEKDLAAKKAEHSAVCARLRELGVRMNQ